MADPEPSVQPRSQRPADILKSFGRRLAAGAEVSLPNGGTERRLGKGLLATYPPRFELRIFTTTIYLSRVRQNESLRFFVAYVVQDAAPNKIFMRLFYKDVTLIWRCASHYAQFDTGVWIGKGAVTTVREKGMEYLESLEETTDLPLEIQTALETYAKALKRVPYDEFAVTVALRRAPRHRLEPYRDFSAPREAAARRVSELPNRGRLIAKFRRRNDPASLVIAKGFEPDFRAGVVERTALLSSLYGGEVVRYRIIAANRTIQYSFIASARHYFIGSVQSLSQELSSFAVRVVDARVDELLLLPGYDYHFIDDDVSPPQWHSQIPEGFAGATSKNDPSRADASKWLNRVPVLRAFKAAHRGGRLRVMDAG